MYKRILSKPLEARKSFFLFGPRGTGKTSWLRQHLPQAVFIDLLYHDTWLRLSRRPSALLELIPSNYKGWVIIDEIQRVPALLQEVHRLIEEQGLLFAITGSSTRKIKSKDSNLLAGRALLYPMHPFVCQELGEDFHLAKALQNGMLPSITYEQDPFAYLKTYVHLYLKEEVMAEGLSRNLGAFNRFLELASFSQAQVLNMNAIARDAGVSEKTVRNYFLLLEDLLLAYKLPVFAKRAKRDQLIKHPKFYLFDVGVFRTLRPKGPFDQTEEIEGAALETLFFQSLRAINDLYDLGYQIYYWRTKSGYEVDFVLYGERGLKVFEIKRRRSVTSKNAKSLFKFQETYPIAACFLLYGGNERLFFDKVRVIPFIDALKELPNLLSEMCS